MGGAVGETTLAAQVLNCLLTVYDVVQRVGKTRLLEGDAEQHEIILGILRDQDVIEFGRGHDWCVFLARVAAG